MRRTTAALLVLLAAAWATPIALARTGDCSNTSVGFTPINDLGTGTYKGRQGGLYPGGANKRPAAHTAQGISLVEERVKPRKADGTVDTKNGKLVFLSVGMSNAEMEFDQFVNVAAADHDKSGRVVVINGAQAGQEASEAAVEGRRYWRNVDDRLAAAGVTAEQVGAMWLKQADGAPNLPFDEHVDKLEEDLASIVKIAKSRFPNLWVVYVSSRSYGGYAVTDVSPEPWAYWEGFAAKGLIERQLTGSLPVGTAPWLSWGPYLWADGTKGRSDGLKWFCNDFQQDGTHPSKAGTVKVAAMLKSFFHTDATAKLWYTGAGGSGTGSGTGVSPSPSSPTPTPSASTDATASPTPTDTSIAAPGSDDGGGGFPSGLLLLAMAPVAGWTLYRGLQRKPPWPHRGGG